MENNELLEQETDQELVDTSDETTQDTSSDESHHEESLEKPLKQEKKSPSSSWKELREKNERLERERDEALRIAYQFQLQQQSLQQQSFQPQKQQEIELDDDDIVDVKTLKAYNRQQQLRFEEQQRIHHEMLAENKIMMEFPDYYQIVNSESIDKLNKSDPDIAYTLSQIPDFYKKARATYANIKKMKSYEPSEEEYVNDKISAKNSSKPRPVNSINARKGASALEHASSFEVELTPERKQQIYEQMRRDASSR